MLRNTLFMQNVLNDIPGKCLTAFLTVLPLHPYHVTWHRVSKEFIYIFIRINSLSFTFDLKMMLTEGRNMVVFLQFVSFTRDGSKFLNLFAKFFSSIELSGRWVPGMASSSPRGSKYCNSMTYVSLCTYARDRWPLRKPVYHGPRMRCTGKPALLCCYLD